MHPTIYLDTSVISYLTGPPSTNSITRACQQLTHLWWHHRCDPSKTFVSNYVIAEIEQGDPLSIVRRMTAIAQLPRVPEGERTRGIAELLVSGGGLKANAMRCAHHIACAASNRSDILLTWNCRDIANTVQFPLLRVLILAQELYLPELSTPFGLMENSYENI